MTAVPMELDRVRRVIALFYSGHVDFMRGLFAEDIVWRVPHTHPLAADIVGVDGVLELMRRVRAETNGTFSAEPLDIAVNGGTIFCRMKLSAQRGTKVLDQHAVLLWRLNASGKISERDLFMEDPAAADEFWSF